MCLLFKMNLFNTFELHFNYRPQFNIPHACKLYVQMSCNGNNNNELRHGM